MTDQPSGEVILHQREDGTTATEARLDEGATHKYFLSVRREGSRNVEREVATKFRNWAEAATCRIFRQIRTEATVRHFRTVRQDRAVALERTPTHLTLAAMLHLEGAQ